MNIKQFLLHELRNWKDYIDNPVCAFIISIISVFLIGFIGCLVSCQPLDEFPLVLLQLIKMFALIAIPSTIVIGLLAGVVNVYKFIKDRYYDFQKEIQNKLREELVRAICDDDVEGVIKFIKNGADITRNDFILVRRAVNYDSFNVIRYLIENSKEIDWDDVIQNSNGSQAMIECIKNHLKLSNRVDKLKEHLE